MHVLLLICSLFSNMYAVKGLIRCSMLLSLLLSLYIVTRCIHCNVGSVCYYFVCCKSCSRFRSLYFVTYCIMLVLYITTLYVVKAVVGFDLCIL